MSKDRRHLHSVPPPNEGKRTVQVVEARALPELAEHLAPPSSLSDAELVVWSQLRAEYGDQLAESDHSVFAKLVANEATYRDAIKTVRSVGAVIKSPSGYPIQNPYLAIANKAEERALKLLVQLGLTPLARSRVKASKTKALRTNPFDGLKSL